MNKNIWRGSLAAIAAMFMCMSSASVAGEVSPGGWSGWDKIEVIYPANNGLNVTFKTVSFPGGVCDGGRQFYIDIDDIKDQVYASALMAAFLAGSEVSIVWDGTTHNNSACRGKIDRFRVR